MLKLRNESKEVKIKMSNINIIPKVEKRSATQAIFEIDKDQSQADSLNILNRLLTNYQSSPVSIELRDMRNKTITSKSYTLPIHGDTQ